VSVFSAMTRLLGPARGGFGAAKERGSALPGAGHKDGLGYCYLNSGLLAREQHDRKTEREKLGCRPLIYLPY
jgi:hypothetical protein